MWGWRHIPSFPGTSASRIPSSYPDAVLQIIEDGGSKAKGFPANYWVRESQFNKEWFESSQSYSRWKTKAAGLGGTKSHGLPLGDGIRNRDMDSLLPGVTARTQEARWGTLTGEHCELSYKFTYRSHFCYCYCGGWGKKATELRNMQSQSVNVQVSEDVWIWEKGGAWVCEGVSESRGARVQTYLKEASALWICERVSRWGFDLHFSDD